MTFRKFSSLAVWATGLSLLFGICGCERMARDPAASTAIDADTSPQIATEAAQWMVNPEPESLEPEASKDFVLWAVAPEANESVVDQVVRHVNEHADGKVAFSFEKSAYVETRKDLPIGVFDSGIGGLTVLEAILSLDAFNNDNLRPGPDGRPDFANERFLYLGDQANMPYGNYAAHAKEDFLRELILKDTVFLLGKRRWASPLSTQAQWDKPPVKAIVIACNTATAYGLDDVRQAIKAWGIPVIVVGVVESGARSVNELILKTDSPKTIAVMATLGTCASKAYPKAIAHACGIAGKRNPHVIQQGSAELAGAIEGDPNFLMSDHESQQATIASYIREDVFSLLDSYRQSGATEPIEMIVLGCTHFPLVQDEITRAFDEARNLSSDDQETKLYKELIAEKIQFINPAESVAKELFRELAKNQLRIDDNEPSHRLLDSFYITVPSPDLASSARTASGELTSEYKYGRQPGRLTVEDTRAVPLDVNDLPETSRILIQNRLPNVWNRLSKSLIESE